MLNECIPNALNIFPRTRSRNKNEIPHTGRFVYGLDNRIAETWKMESKKVSTGQKIIIGVQRFVVATMGEAITPQILSLQTGNA